MKDGLITLLVLLVGCTTLDPQSQAVVSTINRGYAVEDPFATVVVVGDIKDMPFMKHGYFDPETKVIYLLENATYNQKWHEYMHLYLFRAGVDIGKHHKIINMRN